MELRDLAEQILFATTLEEKLRCPEELTDERPGPALQAPASPGRPVDLQFKARGSGPADFPGVQRLEQPSERGRLLHFFANHELLATELMALVLLRFPQAPAAFRRGVLNTLQDEQAHTRWYVDRMRACGVGFGELPVSGYFWRCVAPMENPIDYVAGLCLTFEQANLDFAQHYARGFQRVGDADTARLLDQIYRDEIGHVAYGLKWFRRWKNPDESDWEAFCRTLRFPLSPQRAKGLALNVEGRRAAGFDPDFIARLEVFAQSRGRTPSVLVFNPFAEGHIAGGRAFTSTQHQARLARDLANLPQFLCRADDLVLVPQRPAVEFLSSLKRAGFALPEFVELEPPGGGGGVKGLAPRKLGRLRPWAWGPDSMELLAPLFGSVSGEARTAEQRFNPGIAKLYSKAWSAEFLAGVLNHRRRAPAAPSWAEETWLCRADEIGVTTDSLEGTLDAIAAIRRRGHHRVVAKREFGVAGQNALRLWEPELLESQRRWLANATAHGRRLVVEPWLARELDFSVQLEMTAQGLKLCGYTGLLNDHRGQFQANWAEPHHHKQLPVSVSTLLAGPADIASRLHELFNNIIALLEAEFRRVDYLGPAGIDAFVYRASDGRCRLKPVVEINPRYTMGRLTVELMKRASPGSYGKFQLVSLASARAAGWADFPSYAKALQATHPLQLEGQPVPRIREGALCLNDPAATRVCLAVFEVSPRPFVAAETHSSSTATTAGLNGPANGTLTARPVVI
jgi:uncharacterized ferritin-like protein (DUF455 family)